MNTNKLKKYTLANVIVGYIMMSAFLLLVLLNRGTVEPTVVEIVKEDPDGLFSPVPEEELVIETTPTGDRFVGHPIIIDRDVGYTDRLTGVVLNDPDPVVAVVGNDPLYVDRDRDLIVGGRDVYVDDLDRIGTVEGGIGGGGHVGHRDRLHGNGRVHDRDRVGSIGVDDDGVVVDRGLLDRRLAELDRAIADRDPVDEDLEIGLDVDKGSIDFGGLTLARKGDDIELGELDDLQAEIGDGNGEGYGVGRGGQLYAYNYPSQGVGAGIGNSAIGAGSGAGAGLGAGIGEGVSDGETVPTLGGIGTYSSVPVVTPGTGTDTDGDGLTAEAEAALGTDPDKPDSDGDGYVDGAEIEAGYSPRDARSNPGKPGTESLPAIGGVGGLVGGAGAGGAAGLVTGMVTKKIGIGIGPGTGCAEHGGDCDGHHGHGGHAKYDHLPKDGALHIMMHVDGSGSILNTRKQLDIMKDTLLKTALLPYYNNDEGLYNRRVTIVDGSGERTLKFFTEAAKKDNVLAVVFQDEAQPAYHLPNFNKKPEEHYLDDLGKLKASLNGYGGVYRGVMFQVDRGKTFAKSFKEFVGNAFRGEGYLESSSLKKYYRDNNNHHIRNRDGVVFSDEYHAKDAGDPKYYLDLIFNASKKVGLDLDIYGAGLTDGRYNKKTD